jgi:hypothetical protein
MTTSDPPVFDSPAPFDGLATYCMFVGYPRSGHGLVGSLLNAHRNAVIAHELHALEYVRRGCPRDQLFALVLRRDRDFTASGSAWMGYRYEVPNQWQGRFETLRVIGDKKGGESTRLLARHPELLDELRALIALPLRIIHVTRNPFDNIATIARRQDLSLADAAKFYFWLARTVADLIARLDPGEVRTVRHEDVIAQPRERLVELCQFVGLDAPPDYVEDCAGIVFEKPSRTRATAAWDEATIASVAERASAFAFLRDYAYDS